MTTVDWIKGQIRKRLTHVSSIVGHQLNMLTPTTPVILDPIEVQKQIENYEKVTARAQQIFEIVPDDPDGARYWRVNYPDMLGISRWYNSLFGRNRWYENFPTEVDPLVRNRLLATAPAQVQAWDSWHQPDQFINLLNSEYIPYKLAKRYGSNLAALQMIADLWDHLQVRDKFTQQLQLPWKTALLYSATSLLNWPSHFAQEMSHLQSRQNEYAGHRVSLEVARNRVLTKHWLKALTTYSSSLETACKLRQLLMIYLLEHREKKLKLFSPWDRISVTIVLTTKSSSAPDVEQSGNSEQRPSVPVLRTTMSKDRTAVKAELIRTINTPAQLVIPDPPQISKKRRAEWAEKYGALYEAQKKKITA